MGLALGTVTAAVSAQSVTTPGVVGDTLKPPPELLQPQAAPAVTAPPERPQADAPPAGGRAGRVDRMLPLGAHVPSFCTVERSAGK